MPRGPVKWIASRMDPWDHGSTPAFPYELFRPIAQRSDVLVALGSDCQVIEDEMGASVFQTLVDTLWEINRFPLLFTSHTLAWVDQDKTIPEEFDWAAHRAHCTICILPRDEAVPDLETARIIVNQLHRALLRTLRVSPPASTSSTWSPL